MKKNRVKANKVKFGLHSGLEIILGIKRARSKEREIILESLIPWNLRLLSYPSRSFFFFFFFLFKPKNAMAPLQPLKKDLLITGDTFGVEENYTNEGAYDTRYL